MHVFPVRFNGTEKKALGNYEDILRNKI